MLLRQTASFFIWNSDAVWLTIVNVLGKSVKCSTNSNGLRIHSLMPVGNFEWCGWSSRDFRPSGFCLRKNKLWRVGQERKVGKVSAAGPSALVTKSPSQKEEKHTRIINTLVKHLKSLRRLKICDKLAFYLQSTFSLHPIFDFFTAKLGIKK